jgi:heme/copper-type cytochrome/quinol oxidase subunit 3
MKRQLAWGVLTLWIGFWTYFVAASGITDGGGWPALVRVLVFSVVFGAGALTAWRWPERASVVLFITSIGLTLAILLGAKKNPPLTQLFLLATMALPPLLAAKLLQYEPKG